MSYPLLMYNHLNHPISQNSANVHVPNIGYNSRMPHVGMPQTNSLNPYHLSQTSEMAPQYHNSQQAASNGTSDFIYNSSYNGHSNPDFLNSQQEQI